MAMVYCGLAVPAAPVAPVDAVGDEDVESDLEPQPLTATAANRVTARDVMTLRRLISDSSAPGGAGLEYPTDETVGVMG
jgi:hypothetical protein